VVGVETKVDGTGRYSRCGGHRDMASVLVYYLNLPNVLV